jgi:hypothetical protein
MTRNPDGSQFDPRFGINGDRIGNALSEPYCLFAPPEPIPVSYPRLCPGQFFYVGIGDYPKPRQVDMSDKKSPDEWKTGWSSDYYLGGIGSITSLGMDVIRWVGIDGHLRDEYPHVSETEVYWFATDYSNAPFLRLPEVLGGKAVPVWPPWGLDGEFLYGCPDGYRDGVLMTLTGKGRRMSTPASADAKSTDTEPAD